MKVLSNKEKAFILMNKDQSREQIADELELSISTVVKYEKDFEVAKIEGTLDKILNSDIAIVEEIAEYLPNDTTDIVKELKGLDRLNTNMQNAAELILRKLTIVTNNVGPDDVVNLTMATEVLCKLQNAFFNKNSLNLNVQNNTFSGEDSTYKEFLDDKPPINN